MLRSEHSIVKYDFKRMMVQPDRLHRNRDDHYLSLVQVAIELYQDGVGKTRQSLHREVEDVFFDVPLCPPRRVAALLKLLDDHAIFDKEKGAAASLRQKVFSLAAPMHPLVEKQEGMFDHTIETARQSISDALGLPWGEIESKLFSDVIELQVLREFLATIEPESLLSQYNVAQTQAALYRAVRVRVEAHADFKTILRHAKLAGLMHRITPLQTDSLGYRFDFDGPQSSLRETTRYGIRFARLLPKLLACRDWSLTAEILGPREQRFRMSLSPRDGLKSPLDAPEEFDSELEKSVLSVWESSPVDGWEMQRESEIMVRGQEVLTPDFVLFQSSSGRKVFIEVVGFWPPEYLQEKCKRLSKFLANSHDEWLLMFTPSKTGESQAYFEKLSLPSVVFTQRSKPEEWIPLG